jgi:hypothetical protein
MNMKLLGFVLLMAGLLKCDGTSEVIKCYAPDCAQVATVRDLTGLDGCGVVLELIDGTRLIPERRVYVQAPKPEEDPLYYFELKADDKVQISYQESLALSGCMNGKIVFITCIKPLSQNSIE